MLRLLLVVTVLLAMLLPWSPSNDGIFVPSCCYRYAFLPTASAYVVVPAAASNNNRRRRITRGNRVAPSLSRRRRIPTTTTLTAPVDGRTRKRNRRRRLSSTSADDDGGGVPPYFSSSSSPPSTYLSSSGAQQQQQEEESNERYGSAGTAATTTATTDRSDDSEDDEERAADDDDGANAQLRSYVRSIRSVNLAGVVGGGDGSSGGGDDDEAVGASSSSSSSTMVEVPLERRHRHRRGGGSIDDDDDDDSNGGFLTAVTGETGSGKSLLVARAVELLAGTAKKSSAASLLLPVAAAVGGGGGSTYNYEEEEQQGSTSSIGNNSEEDLSACVEMDIVVRGRHLGMAEAAFESMGIDPASLFDDEANGDSSSNGGPKPERDRYGLIRVKRTLLLQPPSGKAKKPRLKSVCTVNDRQVTLKLMSALVRPLLAVVDAAAASSALSNREARMSILDTAVRRETLANAARSKARYRRCRQRREQLQDEHASRALPPSFRDNGGQVGGSDDKQLELLGHWIDELDAFETRVTEFCASVVVEESEASFDSTSASLSVLGRELAETSWHEGSSKSRQGPFASLQLQRLSRFRDALLRLDDQLASARLALDAVGSLSSPESAMTAVERARRFLFDASGEGYSGTPSPSSPSKATEAAERAHDLLNAIEDAISECVDALGDDDVGLIRAVELERSLCRVSVEDIDLILSDWSTLARKHGVSPSSLPSCHAALKAERDGNVEALALMPKAVAEEEAALGEFEEACRHLSKERDIIASRLSASVTERLPSLGMDKSIFRVDVDSKSRHCTDWAAYGTSSAILGLDSADFVLYRRKQLDDGTSEIQGRVHEVASSGEKARILLAIECALPGSVGATLGCSSPSAQTEDVTSLWATNLAPITVLYDEIDAHVGGHAAVALASMLVDQSLSSQVIAITHSPSVAAVADLHVVVKKMTTEDTNNGKGLQGVMANRVAVGCVDGLERRRELARMASGDLAVAEAEAFADALIRDGAKRRKLRP